MPKSLRIGEGDPSGHLFLGQVERDFLWTALVSAHSSGRPWQKERRYTFSFFPPWTGVCVHTAYAAVPNRKYIFFLFIPKADNLFTSPPKAQSPFVRRCDVRLRLTPSQKERIYTFSFFPPWTGVCVHTAYAAVPNRKYIFFLFIPKADNLFTSPPKAQSPFVRRCDVRLRLIPSQEGPRLLRFYRLRCSGRAVITTHELKTAVVAA